MSPERCAAVQLLRVLRREAHVERNRQAELAVAAAALLPEMLMAIAVGEAVATLPQLRLAQHLQRLRPLRPLLKAAGVEAAVCVAAQQCRVCRSSSRHTIG